MSELERFVHLLQDFSDSAKEWSESEKNKREFKFSEAKMAKCEFGISELRAHKEVAYSEGMAAGVLLAIEYAFEHI